MIKVCICEYKHGERIYSHIEDFMQIICLTIKSKYR